MPSLFTRFTLGIMGILLVPAWLMAVDVAPGKIDHFTITAPSSARVGEAIDVTVEAKDAADKIITNYRGSIYFQSDTDFGATLPAQ